MQQPVTRQRRMHRTAPVLALFVLAPLMGEVLGAALRLSNFLEPLRVAAIVCFYGAGVVLLREIATRFRLSTRGLVLLGVWAAPERLATCSARHSRRRCSGCCW